MSNWVRRLGSPSGSPHAEYRDDCRILALLEGKWEVLVVPADLDQLISGSVDDLRCVPIIDTVLIGSDPHNGTYWFC